MAEAFSEQPKEQPGEQPDVQPHVQPEEKPDARACAKPNEEKNDFECCICNLKQKYNIKGKWIPSEKYIKLKEDSYLMEDPFCERTAKSVKDKYKSFIILGSDCFVCKNQVCQGSDCSIYYKNRYCQKCASAKKDVIPEQLHDKIKQIV